MPWINKLYSWISLIEKYRCLTSMGTAVITRENDRVPVHYTASIYDYRGEDCVNRSSTVMKPHTRRLLWTSPPWLPVIWWLPRAWWTRRLGCRCWARQGKKVEVRHARYAGARHHQALLLHPLHMTMVDANTTGYYNRSSDEKELSMISLRRRTTQNMKWERRANVNFLWTEPRRAVLGILDELE